MRLVLSPVIVLLCKLALVKSENCIGIDANIGCECRTLYEIPSWVDIKKAPPIKSITGLVAENCSSLLIHEKLPSLLVNNFRILILKTRSLDHSLTINGSSFNGTSKKHLKDFHWRLAKIGNVTIKSGAFENVQLNLHIYDVSNLVIEEGAFVKCTGSITLHHVTAFIARNAAVASRLAFIRAGLVNNTEIWIVRKDNRSSIPSKQRVLSYNHLEDRPPSNTKLLLIVTLGGVVALLVVACFLLIATVVIIKLMEKLYRHNYESLGGSKASRDLQRPDGNAPMLPTRPPPEAPVAGRTNGRQRY